MSLHMTFRGYNPLFADDKAAHKAIFETLGLKDMNGAGASELHNIDCFRSDTDEAPDLSALQLAVDVAFPRFVAVQHNPTTFLIGEPTWVLPTPK